MAGMRTPLLALAGLTTAALVTSGLPAQAATTVPVPPGATSVTLSGQGYGHGHGMSQYGAKVAAEQGLSQEQIMAFYYPGTAVGTGGGAMRVLLSTRKRLVVVNQPKLRAHVVGGRSYKLAKAGPRKARSAKLWRAAPAGHHTLLQYKTGGRWKKFRKVSGDVEFSAGKLPLTLRAGPDSGTFSGTLRAATPAGRPGDRDIVNRVKLERYVRGVVAREMPATWAPAAVQAQAVAARTYAVYERGSANRGHFDVYDTTQSQVYGGVGAETTASNAAVRATARQIRTHNGAAAFTQFSSSNGGWMLANSAFPYLVSGPDPYDPVNTWQLEVPLTKFAERFPSTSPLASITLSTHPNAGPWVDKVTLTSVNGATNTIDGAAFRSWAGLRSASFRVG